MKLKHVSNALIAAECLMCQNRKFVYINQMIRAIYMFPFHCVFVKQKIEILMDFDFFIFIIMNNFHNNYYINQIIIMNANNGSKTSAPARTRAPFKKLKR